MGDISIIARRLSDKYVQYGWSGNGGYPGTVGACLWIHYNTPDMVEYLFGLGQLRSLSSPGSDHSSQFFRTKPTGQSHWVGNGELDIYSKIAFVDHVYLYDSDERWYYIAPIIARIKIPLNIVLNHTNKSGILNQNFRLYLERAAFKTIQQWYDENQQFREYASEVGCDHRKITELRQRLEQSETDCSIYGDIGLVASLSKLYRYFYPWAVAKIDGSRERIEKIIFRPQNAIVHLETIEWNF